MKSTQQTAEAPSGYLTTGQVLEALRRLGLDVTATHLDNDTRGGFLPKRPELDVVETGRGRSGRWEIWMVLRAERLYRYRRIKDANGEPALSGDVLRLLLFLHDGWGWSPRIRDAALRGLDKSIAATLKPVATYTKRYRDKTDITTAMMMHELHATPAEKFSIGMLATGEPLDDATLKPLYDLAKKVGLLDGLVPLNAMFAAFTGMKQDDAGAFFAEGIFTVGLGSYFRSQSNSGGYAKLFRSAIQNLDDEAAKESVPVFCRFIRTVRSFIHRESIKENRAGFHTNPLTMFGRRQRDVEQTLREKRFPRRITAAQMLALFFAISAVGDQMVQSLIGNANLFNILLQSLLTPKTKAT